MAGSTFGKIFRVTTWGESHGKALGAVVDGCPAGLSLCENDIQVYLNRRRPGQGDYSTPRNESDSVEILSGVFDGKTTGTPISLIVYNKDQHSGDYNNLASIFRPGHADYTFESKYGIRDYRGGGRSSGRETIGRVAAGAIAVKLLQELGITFTTYVSQIGSACIDYNNFDKEYILQNELFMPDKECVVNAEEILESKIAEGNSIGSKVECIISGVPIGIGEPVFDKLDAVLSKAIMGIGAVKAVEIGDGTAVVCSNGLLNNDSFRISNGSIVKSSNHSGGTLGGISDGSNIIVKASFKPTPSIFSEQETVGQDGMEHAIKISGRHDPIIGPRAAVVVETMCASTILDLMLINLGSKLDNIKKLYQ